jgi:hypothetical protein
METLLAMLLEAGRKAGLYDSEKVRSEWAKIERNGFNEKELLSKIVQEQIRKYVKENFLSSFPFKDFFVNAIFNVPAKLLVNQIFTTFDSYLEKNFKYSQLSFEEFIPKFLSYLSEKK